MPIMLFTHEAPLLSYYLVSIRSSTRNETVVVGSAPRIGATEFILAFLNPIQPLTSILTIPLTNLGSSCLHPQPGDHHPNAQAALSNPHPRTQTLARKPPRHHPPPPPPLLHPLPLPRPSPPRPLHQPSNLLHRHAPLSNPRQPSRPSPPTPRRTHDKARQKYVPHPPLTPPANPPLPPV